MPFRSAPPLQGLNQEEKVYLVVRQHWIVPVLKISAWLGLMILVLSLETFLKTSFPILNKGVADEISGIIRVMFLMLVALGLLIVWTMYYLNVQVVTNERIIDVNQKSLLHHSTSEFHLIRCQDVTTEIKGLLANFFDYGNVLVQTAGEEDNFVFNHIAEPHKIAKIVLELYERIKKEHPIETV